MSTKLVKKGLLTPIKYITKIFDPKEPEMQIGLPTNVRHVGHIGAGEESDGPTWMASYHSAPLNDPGSPASSTTTSTTTTQWASQGDISTFGAFTDSPLNDAQLMNSPRSKPRHSRRCQSEGTAIPVDSSETVVKKKGRKLRKKKEGSGERPDVPVPKKTNKKKSKGDVSTKPRRKDTVVAPEEMLDTKPADGELDEILLC